MSQLYVIGYVSYCTYNDTVIPSGSSGSTGSAGSSGSTGSSAQWFD